MGSFLKSPIRSFWSRSPETIDRVIALAGVILTFPIALEAFLHLIGSSLPVGIAIPPPVVGGLLRLGLFSMAFAAIRWLVRGGLDYRASVVLRPLDGPITGAASVRHEMLILDQRRVLRMTLNELATRMGLPRWQVSFLIRRPYFVPRADIEDRLGRALMVTPEWPEKGYGSECTRNRLLWYHYVKRIEVSLIYQIDHVPMEIQEVILQAIEEKVRASFDE
jgi:hypothetical protein